MTKALVQFIQDRSGSMGDVWKETLNGYRQFVKELKEKGAKDGIEYRFTLTTFDTIIDTPVRAQPIAEVSEESLMPHPPRGATALYDAVGATIQATDESRDGAEKVVVVIVTDGHENSSREWTKERLHAAVDTKLAGGNWTFTYLGTQPETWDDALAIGIGVGSSASYVGTRATVAYAATASAVHSLCKSDERGTRSLMTSHGDRTAMRNAGMTVRDRAVPSTKTPFPTNRPRRPESGSNRWR